MKTLTKVALAAAMVAGACGSANASGFGVELNGARSYGQWGAELGVGYRAKFGIFDITPTAGGFLYRGDSHGYFTTTDSNGTEHCRASNGQFADKDKCDRVAGKAYGRLEAGVSVPTVGRFAVGGRYIGSQVKPYGAVSFALMPKVAMKANGGQHYGALGVTFGF